MTAPKSATQFIIRHDTESSYGSGGSPASAAKALMAFDATMPQLNADKKTRPFVLPFFGARPFVLANKSVPAPFFIEAQGSGTPGTAPPYGRLLLDGGFTETTVSDTATVQAAATRVGTPTGAFTYTVGDAGTPKTMRTVTLLCTTGGGSGTAEFTVSAPASGKGVSAENAYNATGVVMTDSQTFELASGVEITPMIGTAFAQNDTFTIDIGPDRVEYDPTSDRDNHDSGILHWHMNDHKFVIVGARNTFNFQAASMDYARFGFQYMGQYADPTKVALPTVDYSAFKDPEIVETDNTWLFELFGIACKMKSFSVNIGNRVNQRTIVGREEIRIGGREVTGNCVIEAPDLDTKNYFASVTSHTKGTLRFVHGTTPGKIIEVRGGAVQLDPIRPENDQDDLMLNINLTFQPVDLSAGDDEIKFLFM